MNISPFKNNATHFSLHLILLWRCKVSIVSKWLEQQNFDKLVEIEDLLVKLMGGSFSSVFWCHDHEARVFKHFGGGVIMVCITWEIVIFCFTYYMKSIFHQSMLFIDPWVQNDYSNPKHQVVFDQNENIKHK